MTTLATILGMICIAGALLVGVLAFVVAFVADSDTARAAGVNTGD